MKLVTWRAARTKTFFAPSEFPNNTEEKSLRHVAMVANFLNNNKLKTSLKSEYALFQSSLILFNFISFVKCWRHFLVVNAKGPYISLEKEKGLFCVLFSYFIKRAHEIRKFHVAVVQPRLRNVQKSVMHVQSCCFANKHIALFCRSLYRRRRPCYCSSLLLWTRNFATMVMWRHTSPLYWTSLVIWDYI